jgi:hypothetical protein
LIDLDGSDSLQDEEIVPLLKAAGLDDAAAKSAALRLLGDQLTVLFLPVPRRRIHCACAHRAYVLHHVVRR